MEAEQPDKLLQFANTGHGTDRKAIPLLPAEPPPKEETVTTKTVERTLPMPQTAIQKPKGGPRARQCSLLPRPDE